MSWKIWECFAGYSYISGLKTLGLHECDFCLLIVAWNKICTCGSSKASGSLKSSVSKGFSVQETRQGKKYWYIYRLQLWRALEIGVSMSLWKGTLSPGYWLTNLSRVASACRTGHHMNKHEEKKATGTPGGKLPLHIHVLGYRWCGFRQLGDDALLQNTTHVHVAQKSVLALSKGLQEDMPMSVCAWRHCRNKYMLELSDSMLNAINGLGPIWKHGDWYTALCM